MSHFSCILWWFLSGRWCTLAFLNAYRFGLGEVYRGIGRYLTESTFYYTISLMYLGSFSIGNAHFFFSVFHYLIPRWFYQHSIFLWSTSLPISSRFELEGSWTDRFCFCHFFASLCATSSLQYILGWQIYLCLINLFFQSFPKPF